MKQKTFFAALKIAVVTFLISHIAYAVLTLPFAYGRNIIWVYSIRFALLGSGVIGLPLFFLLLWQICSRRVASPEIFQKKIRSAAVVSAGLSALAVTIYFGRMLSPRETFSLILFLPLTGALSPLPVLWMLRKGIAKIFWGLGEDRR